MLLYFLHIQKTAGTSFNKFLSQYYSESEIFPGKLWKDFVNWFPKSLEQFSLISGHFGYGLVRFLPENSRVITMLRDPIERTISQYHHTVSDKYFVHKVNEQEVRKIGDGSLDALLQNKDVVHLFSNIQVKNLGIDRSKASTPQSNELEYFNSVTEEMYPNALLLAKERLSNMFFFGIQEYFTQSYILLGYLLGVTPYYDGSFNMIFENRPKRESFNESVIEKLEKMNTFDKELYDFAKRLFMERYTLAFKELSEELGVSAPSFENTEAVKKMITLKKQRI